MKQRGLKGRKHVSQKRKREIAQPGGYRDIYALQQQQQQQLVDSSPETESEQREKTLIITYRYSRKIAAPDLP